MTANAGIAIYLDALAHAENVSAAAAVAEAIEDIAGELERAQEALDELARVTDGALDELAVLDDESGCTHTKRIELAGGHARARVDATTNATQTAMDAFERYTNDQDERSDR